MPPAELCQHGVEWAGAHVFFFLGGKAFAHLFGILYILFHSIEPLKMLGSDLNQVCGILIHLYTSVL